MIRLSELLKGLDIISVAGDTGTMVKGITDDSREVKNGYIFACMPAVYDSDYAHWVYNTDGHNYITDAINRGAAVVVLQDPSYMKSDSEATCIHVRDTRYALAKMSAEFYGNPADKLIMVGITGTNGKTSTSYLSKAVLEAGNLKTGILGTITHRIAGKDTPAGMTTPVAHRLQKMLSDALSEDFDSVVMETSSHALELKRVDGIGFDVGVFTNITQDHLDFHKDMAGYLGSKTRLFSHLMKVNKSAFAVVNADDPASQHIIRNTKAKVITYAVNSEADLKVMDFQPSVDGLFFRTRIQGDKELKVKLQLLGEYSLYNALAAMGVGISQGLDLEVIKTGLESVPLVPGRFEKVDCGQDYTVVVDYAHTPDALERVLSAAKKLTKGKLISVFGCGGDRDKGKRPLMGRVATALSDYSVITSDNPRTEDPLEIISHIKAGAEDQGYEAIPDRREAIRRALEIAEAGDMVVIAGKGHENYQILKDGRIHFDDREIVCEVLGNRIKQV
jgi:UDP-N-acetylmuramoyl-L-alanyl-D-glutamate--2,6-diaminopimelate ligase